MSKNSLRNTFLKIAILMGVGFPQLGTVLAPAFGENLEQAWDIAIRENNELKAKQHAVAAASAGVEAAHGARLPQVTNATAYVVLSDQPTFKVDMSGLSSAVGGLASLNPALGPALASFPTSISTPIANQNTLFSTTQAILPMYTGGRITSIIDQAEARAEAARQGERTDLLDLKLDVAENYVLVLRMNRLVQVIADTQREMEVHVRNVADLMKQGVVTENVFLAAQVSKAEVDQQMLQVKQGFDLSKAAYNRYLARPLESPVNLESLAIPAPSGELENLTQTALAYRSELNQLAAESNVSSAKSREYRSETLPNVAVAGGYTYLENDYLEENNYASASVCMVWTPLDGGVSRAKQKAANHQTAAINRMRDEARTGIELQVRQCWLNETETRSRLAVAQTSVTQATKNLEIVRNQFNQGVAPHTDYLQAVSLKTQADVNLCNALCDAIIASYRLRRATGTL